MAIIRAKNIAPTGQNQKSHIAENQECKEENNEEKKKDTAKEEKKKRGNKRKSVNL